ncbi:MAG: hypothetical protein ABFD50_09040 [Smithella sp.]
MDNNNSQTQDDEPLFVLRYAPWRIAWRLFWPYLPMLPSFFYLAFFSQGDSGFKLWFCKIFSFIFVVGGIYLIYDMLAMDGIYLFRDRIIKRYRSKKEQVIILEKGTYSSISTPVIGMMYMLDENTPRFLGYFKKYVQFDEKLAAPKDVAKFKEILAEITDQKIVENKFGARKFIQRREDKT